MDVLDFGDLQPFVSSRGSLACSRRASSLVANDTPFHVSEIGKFISEVPVTPAVPRPSETMAPPPPPPPPERDAFELPDLGLPPLLPGQGRVAPEHPPVSMPPAVSAEPPASPQGLVTLTPSTFCHVCGRPNSRGAQVVCSNIRLGQCQKAVCELCFQRNGWTGFAEASAPGSKWQCCHCTDSCPEQARCYVYKKANKRRCIRRRERRLMRNLQSGIHR